jgi:hypothetical protein
MINHNIAKFVGIFGVVQVLCEYTTSAKNSS